MPYTVYQTTAEEIIGATDAVIQAGTGADLNLISEFLVTSLPNATNAANMAVELGLIELDTATNLYSPAFPYAIYLVTANQLQKASVLRLVLETYEPYKLFKSRLKLTTTSNDAANQVKALIGLTAHRAEINHTFISLGTFTNSLTNQGAGKYVPVEGSDYSFLQVVNAVVQSRQDAELKIRERLGEDIIQWINTDDVFNPLVSAFQLSAQINGDPRAPIVHAGNAIESFLVQVGNHYAINMTGANGINAKIDRITQTQLTVKHKNICKYLGHVRNACHHGIDPTIGQAWTISSETSVEYVHISLTAIRSIYDCIQGNYII
ncbi:MAG: hypothetical protein AAFY76_04780 [Cyanobacteria bacterium J06649_11]